MFVQPIKNLALLVSLFFMGNESLGQSKTVYLSPDVDSLYSNKEYMFKVENVLKDSALINVSLDTGFFSSANRVYATPNYAPEGLVGYIRSKKDGSYDLAYDILFMLRCGRIKGANGDAKAGGYCNAYVTVRKNKVIDTIFTKRYYVQFVYDTLRARSPRAGVRFYSYFEGVTNYPKISLAGIPLTYQPKVEEGRYFHDNFNVNTNCAPLKIDKLIAALKARDGIQILPAHSGFKIVSVIFREEDYISFGTTSKTEADISKVLNRISHQLEHFNRAYLYDWHMTLNIHLHNPKTGEYVRIPFYKIPVEE